MRDLFPELLFQLRRRRKLLQKQVADRAKIDQSYLAGLERGRRDPPRATILSRLCDGLEATAEERIALRDAASVSRLYKALDQIENEYSRADTVRRMISTVTVIDAQSCEVLEGIFELLRRDKGVLSKEATMK